MNKQITELHLFAGIGGGIYGGELLGHKCCGAVEIDTFCQQVLKQRQKDKWMPDFPIYGDIKALNGADFKGTFDILCGGFPCQAFSHAAHGKNIAEKNLWDEMLRFVQESDAPIVFGENVTEKAILKAMHDLENIGYAVKCCRLGCGDLNADHKRNRFWLLAVKDFDVFNKIANNIEQLPKFTANFWVMNPNAINLPKAKTERKQAKAIGNAQSPIVAAVAFRILVKRHLLNYVGDIRANNIEISNEYVPIITWIKSNYPNNIKYVHTPTTIMNYCAKSMMKHPNCVKYKHVFGHPEAKYSEYLMGVPIGTSSLMPQAENGFAKWKEMSIKIE